MEVPQQIEECFHSIQTKATEIQDPFEAAFFVMVQLPYLQAFEDVNKRVSRLAANIPLVRQFPGDPDPFRLKYRSQIGSFEK